MRGVSPRGGARGLKPLQNPEPRNTPSFPRRRESCRNSSKIMFFKNYLISAKIPACAGMTAFFDLRRYLQGSLQTVGRDPPCNVQTAYVAKVGCVAQPRTRFRLWGKHGFVETAENACVALGRHTLPYETAFCTAGSAAARVGCVAQPRTRSMPYNGIRPSENP